MTKKPVPYRLTPKNADRAPVPARKRPPVRHSLWAVRFTADEIVQALRIAHEQHGIGSDVWVGNSLIGLDYSWAETCEGDLEVTVTSSTPTTL